jgi:hypothetical protein
MHPSHLDPTIRRPDPRARATTRALVVTLALAALPLVLLSAPTRLALAGAALFVAGVRVGRLVG